MSTDASAFTPAPQSPTNGHSRRVEQLPGPKGLPLLGNLFQLDPRRLHLVLEGWAREHGSVYAFWAGPKPTVVIGDPRLSDQIMRARPDDFRRIDKIETVFAELNMPGVFTAEGAAWRPQRRLLMQALSARRTTAFYPMLSRVVQRLQQRWQQAAARGSTLDMLDEFKRLTVDVTTLLAFGHDANTVEHDEDALRDQLRVIFPAINRRLTAAVPYWRVLRMPADRRAERCIRDLRARLMDLIATTRQRLEADPARRQAPANLLEALLIEPDEQGRPLSDELILGNALQVLLAGEDTTAATLAWTVHLLCEHPEAVAALREELHRVLGANPFPTDAEMAGQLSQLDAIVHETLRIRSVTPLVLLESNKDVVVDGVAVPAGTWVVLLTRFPALEAAHFERPLEFLPERWRDRARDGSDAGEASQRASSPFGGGPRICPGRALALLEMRVALAMLYSGFDVERVGSADRVGERFAFIVEPVALQVKLRPRARTS
jgi:cytochrome P450